jgi:hypothetical protein
VEDLVQRVDTLADDGLREKLAGGVELSRKECQDLLELLVKMDEVLKDEFSEKKTRGVSLITGSRDIMTRCLSRSIESHA